MSWRMDQIAPAIAEAEAIEARGYERGKAEAQMEALEVQEADVRAAMKDAHDTGYQRGKAEAQAEVRRLELECEEWVRIVEASHLTRAKLRERNRALMWSLRKMYVLACKHGGEPDEMRMARDLLAREEEGT